MEDSCDSRLQNCHQIVNSQHWKELVRFLSNAMGNKLSGPKRVMRLGSKISCSKHKRLVIFELIKFEHIPMYLIHNPLSFKRNELPFHDTSLAMLGVLPYFLKLQTVKSKIAAGGLQNGQRGLERCTPLSFGVLPSTFSK